MELGYAHPDCLLEELTSNQISEWEAYDSLDPIGTFRADFRMAKLAATMTNLVLSIYSKKGDNIEFKTPVDFLPKWDSIIEDNLEREEVEPKKQSANEMRDILMRFAANHNRAIDKKKMR